MGSLFVADAAGAVHFLDTTEGSFRRVADSREAFDALFNSSETRAGPSARFCPRASPSGSPLGPGQCFGWKVPPRLGGEPLSRTSSRQTVSLTSRSRGSCTSRLARWHRRITRDDNSEQPSVSRSPSPSAALPPHGRISQPLRKSPCSGESPTARENLPGLPRFSQCAGKSPTLRENLPLRGRISQRLGDSPAPREILPVMRIARRSRSLPRNARFDRTRGHRAVTGR